MKYFILLILFLIQSSNALAALDASVQSPTVSEGQTVYLTLSSDESLSGLPDIAPLAKDFTLLGQSSSSSYQYVNGKMSKTYSYTLSLQPLSTGILDIPSLTWDGQQTPAIQVEVIKASSQTTIAQETAVLIEGEVLTNAPIYEKAAFVYRATVYERAGLKQGHFIPPALDNAEVVPLGDERMGQATKDGRLYQTITQEYAIFPKSTGTLQITPAAFEGVFLKDQRPKDVLQPFGFDMLYAPVATGEQILVRAKGQSIDVLPKPADYQGWWLPANAVTLTGQYNPEPDTPIKVGEVITWTVDLNAQGVLGTMLPELVPTPNDDFKIYPEKPVKSSSYDPKFGVLGLQSISFALVPLKAGELQMPSLAVKWFNVKTGKTETAELRAPVITVEENPQYANAADEPAQTSAASDNAATSNAPEVQAESALISKSDAQSTPSVDSKSATCSVNETKAAYDKENSLLFFVAGWVCGVFLCLVLGLILKVRKTPKKPLPDLYPEK